MICGCGGDYGGGESKSRSIGQLGHLAPARIIGVPRSSLFGQGFAVFTARFAGVRATGAGAEDLIASTVVTKRIP